MHLLVHTCICTNMYNMYIRAYINITFIYALYEHTYVRVCRDVHMFIGQLVSWGRQLRFVFHFYWLLQRSAFDKKIIFWLFLFASSRCRSNVVSSCAYNARTLNTNVRRHCAVTQYSCPVNVAKHVLIKMVSVRFLFFVLFALQISNASSFCGGLVTSCHVNCQQE